MVQSERGGVTIGLVVSSSPPGSIVAVRSTWTSLITRWSPDVGAVVEALPLGLFKVPVLGLALFVWVCHYLRKVAPIGAMIWTNSRAGKSSNLRKFNTLYINTGNNNFCALGLLL